MAKVYYEEHADLEPLSGKTIAVIGYGSQGRSLARKENDKAGG